MHDINYRKAKNYDYNDCALNFPSLISMQTYTSIWCIWPFCHKVFIKSVGWTAYLYIFSLARTCMNGCNNFKMGSLVSEQTTPVVLCMFASHCYQSIRLCLYLALLDDNLGYKFSWEDKIFQRIFVLGQNFSEKYCTRVGLLFSGRTKIFRKFLS